MLGREERERKEGGRENPVSGADAMCYNHVHVHYTVQGALHEVYCLQIW